MCRSGFLRGAIILSVLCLAPASWAAAQGEDEFRIRIAVEEIRLDAVVVDGRGRQITDLTAEDFEIYQDNQPQPEIIRSRC